MIELALDSFRNIPSYLTLKEMGVFEKLRHISGYPKIIRLHPCGASSKIAQFVEWFGICGASARRHSAPASSSTRLFINKRYSRVVANCRRRLRAIARTMGAARKTTIQI